jgi:enolase
MAVGVYEATADVLRERGVPTLKADEGGFGPPLESHAAVLELLDAAVERAGLRPGDDVAYGLDVAATHLYDAETGAYVLASEDRSCSSAELAELIAELAASHPIVSVEDPLAEDDWDGWASFTASEGGRLQVVGDDLFATNPERLERGVAASVANAVLVKMNQIGTVSETLEVVERAKRAGYATVVSARSGETEDAALADLAVATGAGQIKIGSVAQSERLAKYNQLLRIEEALGDDAPYAGRNALRR